MFITLAAMFFDLLLYFSIASFESIRYPSCAIKADFAEPLTHKDVKFALYTYCFN